MVLMDICVLESTRIMGASRMANAVVGYEEGMYPDDKV